ncbi:hypothetical protein, partial [Rhizobium skierniewicense]
TPPEREAQKRKNPPTKIGGFVSSLTRLLSRVFSFARHQVGSDTQNICLELILMVRESRAAVDVSADFDLPRLLAPRIFPRNTSAVS